MASFSKDISEFVKLTGLTGELVLRKVALDTFAVLLKLSPVDTGRFRANWRVGINRVNYDTSAAGKGEPGKYEGDPKGGTEITDRETVQANDKLLQAKWRDTIWLTNNLPYAPALERGHSKQAPVGVLGPAIIIAKQTLEQNIRTIRRQTGV